MLCQEKPKFYSGAGFRVQGAGCRVHLYINYLCQPMSPYQHIFFDLDRTLWDFNASAEDAIKRMFLEYDLQRKGIPGMDVFKERYHYHNDQLWELYRKGDILKEILNVKRFHLTLLDFGLDEPETAKGMARIYTSMNPDRAFLMPGTHEILEYLVRGYQLHLITNGFQEVQDQKFRIGNFDKYIRTMTTSEEAGAKKPDPGIFSYALDKAGCKPEESIIIGDDLEVDIIGARNFGIDQVYYNPAGNPHNEKLTLEIRHLLDLKKIF